MLQKEIAPSRNTAAVASQALFFLALVAAFVLGLMTGHPQTNRIETGASERFFAVEEDFAPSGVSAGGGGPLRGLMVEMPVQ